MARSPRPEPLILDGVLIAPSEPFSCDHDSFEFFAVGFLNGARRVLFLAGPATEAATRNLARFNALLRSRGLPEMRARLVSRSSRAGQRADDALNERQTVARRRAFLALPENNRGSGALQKLQSIQADTPDAIFAATPVIDPRTCTGCDACLRACPQQVLTQINDEFGQSRYSFDPVSCDACGLCVEVCASGAIQVRTTATAPTDIPLQSWCCSDCGVPVHCPKEQERNSGRCAICETNGQSDKLFQVWS